MSHYRIPHYSGIIFVRDGSNAIVPTHTTAGPGDLATIARTVIGSGLVTERLILLALNTRNTVTATVLLSQGGQHGCATTTSDVLRAALLTGRSAFILAHNHPGGDPTPSHDDVQMTQAVARAARLVGLTLVDHVVITDDRYTSMLEAGLLGSS